MSRTLERRDPRTAYPRRSDYRLPAMNALHAPVLHWYADHARDLPWRRPDALPWSGLVSEIMPQQTPVARVLPGHSAWLERWPTPAGLAAEPPGEAGRGRGPLRGPPPGLRVHAPAGAARG